MCMIRFNFVFKLIPKSKEHPKFGVADESKSSYDLSWQEINSAWNQQYNIALMNCHKHWNKVPCFKTNEHFENSMRQIRPEYHRCIPAILINISFLSNATAGTFSSHYYCTKKCKSYRNLYSSIRYWKALTE